MLGVCFNSQQTEAKSKSMDGSRVCSKTGRNSKMGRMWAAKNSVLQQAVFGDMPRGKQQRINPAAQPPYPPYLCQMLLRASRAAPAQLATPRRATAPGRLAALCCEQRLPPRL